MQLSSKEPAFLFSEEDVVKKSALAAAFWQKRDQQNKVVAAAGNNLLKRIYNVDHNAYLADGALSAKTKEMMGLVASAVLRCDDCINYHVIQCYRLGSARTELEECLNVATVVGGTIVVPHLRRAYELMAELYS